MQIATAGDLYIELLNTRTQRDACAAKVDGLAKWRADAEKRLTAINQ
jgi:hypothetical protein